MGAEHHRFERTTMTGRRRAAAHVGGANGEAGRALGTPPTRLARDARTVVHSRRRRPQCAPVRPRPARAVGTIGDMDAGALFRAIRRARGIGQRELAKRAGVRPSTIDRIESGRTAAPSLRLVADIVRANGFALVVADDRGQLLDLDDDRFRYRDRGGRRYPAHLPIYSMNGPQWPYWWGWSRIAWTHADPAVPTWSFYRRPSRRWTEFWLWIDAT
jgi:transcriptional regulator with XRE-family HTH domain